jgi:hypothetical protein
MEWNLCIIFSLSLLTCGILAYDWTNGNGADYRLVSLYSTSLTVSRRYLLLQLLPQRNPLKHLFVSISLDLSGRLVFWTQV